MIYEAKNEFLTQTLIIYTLYLSKPISWTFELFSVNSEENLGFCVFCFFKVQFQEMNKSKMKPIRAAHYPPENNMKWTNNMV